MTYLVQKGNKYGAESSVFNGRVFHSKKEAGYAKLLETLKKASRREERVKRVEYQYPVDIYVKEGRISTMGGNGAAKICRYYADFFVTYADGHKELHEVKGFSTDMFRLKWKLVEAVMNHENPDIILRIIK